MAVILYGWSGVRDKTSYASGVIVDGDFEQYRARLATWLKPDAWRDQLAVAKASPKLRNGQPSRFRGVSILSASGKPEHCNRGCLAWLSEVQNRLRTTFGDGDLFWLPSEHLHLTVADLIAGPAYESSVQEGGHDERLFLQALESIRARVTTAARPLRWRPAGIVFFEHAIGCVLAPVSTQDYQPLVNLRESIYRSTELLNLGVAVPRPYVAHFTLGYFASVPTFCQRTSWLAHNAEVASWFSCASEWTIGGAELMAFDDMVSYRPDPSGWSVTF